MVRRIGIGAAVLVILLGAVAELIAFATPWAKYKVDATGTAVPGGLHQVPAQSVFQVPSGVQYLGVLLIAIAMLAGAIGGQPKFRPACGALALVLGVVAAVLASQVSERARTTIGGVQALGLAEVHVHGSAGPGSLFGMVGPVLLGVGAVVIAWATTRSPGPAPVPAAEEPAAG
jgi:hypothetical protein